ncbi:hypothetical protein NSE_0363 [Neorickettsia sennetsu str. Miyayama]|uniref:Uncharacterized protein n=1 Tax=Ehrlichia sennetsu (strain ATCC VR-367 / Miyayama) TaxID=222891 RepID=Q2GE44_EHRS3|nr:hypothetical protein NSE_0363 [Neorickettsia sennetsu str. Miyayama]
MHLLFVLINEFVTQIIAVVLRLKQSPISVCLSIYFSQILFLIVG